MPGTILFGIDVESASESSLGYTTFGRRMFEELNCPVTWYVTGKTLERYPDAFREVDACGLVELQAHTYDHILLKTVLIEVPEGCSVHGSTDWYLQRGGSFDEIDRDLTRCQGVFEDVLGRKATALTGPWCYYRGLGDRPDLLELLHDKHGFRILRTFGRDERDGQPVPLEWQPFFYKVQGFPDVLELVVHGYQDDFYWRDFGRPGPDDRYEDYLNAFADQVAEKDLVWSLASHDHGCDTAEGFERKGGWMRPFIQYAQGLGIRFVQATEFYNEMRAQQPKT